MTKLILEIKIKNTIYEIKNLDDDWYDVKQKNKWSTYAIPYKTTDSCLKELFYVEHKHNRNKYYQFMIFFMDNGEEVCISEYENDCKCGNEHKCNIDDFQILLEKFLYIQKNIRLNVI